jgi:DNA polymerase III delta prime subunit
VPYPSVDLLAAAAKNLRDRHPLTVITIPALVRAAASAATAPTNLLNFGSRQEKIVLDAFKVQEGKKPYLAVWSDPPALVNSDYPGSTLQRLRTQDILGRSILKDDADQNPSGKRKKFCLRPDAGHTLVQRQKKIYKASLAIWLGRHEDLDSIADLVAWFDLTYPLDGTDLDVMYLDTIPASLQNVENPFVVSPPSDASILERFGIRHTDGLPSPADVARPTEPSAVIDEDEGLKWTREVCEYALEDANVESITARVIGELHDRHIELPDEDQLIRRCVTALLVGHLVLQGPPGTGKTTLARALARGFNCELLESTATSDWSPFHVIGGLRPNPAGGLSPAYGKVSEAVLGCANLVRDAANAEADDEVETTDDGPQAMWLFVDEFNRADIDKAIGSLYTLLSSTDPDHLAASPIDLWFETRPESRRLWVPARFRIIAAMNDLDTSFVNRMSMGLTRRFQFVTVGVPTVQGTSDQPVSREIENAFRAAHDWLNRTYGAVLTVKDVDEARTEMSTQLETLQKVVDSLRRPAGGPGWPLGTAQVVDVLRVLLMHRVSDPAGSSAKALDAAVADRLVPQMGSIDDEQFEAFRSALRSSGLPTSAAALEHLLDPHSLQ